MTDALLRACHVGEKVGARIVPEDEGEIEALPQKMLRRIPGMRCKKLRQGAQHGKLLIAEQEVDVRTLLGELEARRKDHERDRRLRIEAAKLAQSARKAQEVADARIHDDEHLPLLACSARRAVPFRRKDRLHDAHEILRGKWRIGRKALAKDLECLKYRFHKSSCPCKVQSR